MKKGWLAAGLAAALQGFLLLAAGLIFAALFLIKILWAWTIPDLFPGAVEQGLIAGEISWFASLKLALFLGILSAIIGNRSVSTSYSRIDKSG